MYKFSCPYEGCPKRFKGQNGRTYHVRSAHSDNHNILERQSENQPEEEVVHDDHPEPDVEGHEDDHFFDAAEHHENRPSAPASPTQPVAAKPKVQRPTPQRNFHPHINGIFLIRSFFSLL